MLKRLAQWIFRIAYGTTLWQHDEDIKTSFLAKGIERGRAKPREGTIFDLYLARADTSDLIGDDGYARAAQLQGGVPSAAAGVMQWRWWAVANRQGHEVCIGPLETVTVVEALNRYWELLPEEVQTQIGMPTRARLQ
jgi:hypothetical protein